MAKSSVLWLGIFIQLSFFTIISIQFQDPVYESLLEDEQSRQLNDAEKTKFLSQYDKDGDGHISAVEMEQYLHDAMAFSQGKDGKNKPQGHQSAKTKNSKYKTEEQLRPLAINGSQWSIKQIVVSLFGIITFIVICVAIIQRRSGTTGGDDVDVQDMRKARLRKLDAQKGSLSVETSPSILQSTSTKSDAVAVIPDQKSLKRRFKDSSHCDNSNSITEEAKVNKNMVRDSLLSTALDRKKDDQSQHTSTKAIPTVQALSSESSSITASTDTLSISATTLDQKRVDENGVMAKRIGINDFAKTKELKEPKIKTLPYSDVVKIVLSQVLDCLFENQMDSKGKALSLVKAEKNNGRVVLQIGDNEIPKNGDELSKKLEKLLAKRIYKELDPMKFSIQCFDHCCQLPGKDLKTVQDGGKIWKEVTSVLMEPCVKTVLKHLVHAAASPTSAEEDLWSEFIQSNQSEAPSQFFLAHIGGWSCDGVTVNDELLRKLLERGKHDSEVKDTFVEMVTVGGRQVSRVKRVNEITLECKSVFRGLEILLSQATMTEFLAEALERELDFGIKELGVFFQERALFSSFLKMSTVDNKQDKSRVASCFIELPHFPQAFRSDVDQLQSQIMDGIHSCQNVVYKAFVKLLKMPNTKRSALAWLAGVVSLNDLRLKANLPGDNFKTAVAGDGFMLNLCSVALQLCDSFLLSKGQGKHKQIEPQYCSSKACRLRFDNERTLAGGRIGAEDEERTDLRSVLFPSEEMKGQFKLMTEMFHITHSALHVGLNTTIQHYNKLYRNFAMMAEMNEGTSMEAEARKILMLFILQWETCLEDVHFMRLCSEFYITSAAWLLNLLDSCAAENQDLTQEEIHAKQRKIFANIPEFYVKDMCSWFSFVAVHKPGALKGLNICVFVDCCITLIDRRDLMPGPVAASKIVTSQLSFAEICSRKKRKNSLLDTNSWGSGIEGDLVACIAMSPLIREKLAPALIHTYCSVDIVEGLDVDKEEFDKFSARYEIVKLLESLWKRPDILPSILEECGRESFQSFLGAVLDTLLYVLKDGLLRLTNVRKLQCAKKCDEKWKELTPEQRHEKEKFLMGEEHVSKNFMQMANATLAFLEKITEEDKVARCFSRSPLSTRAAAAIIGFLDSLCGRKCVDLKVQNMEKYSFDPRDLLVKILTSLVRMANASEDREFVKCLADNPDYSRLTFEKALHVIQRENLASDRVIQDLRKLLQEVGSLYERSEGHPCLCDDQVKENESELASLEEMPEGAVEVACGSKNENEAYIEALEPLKFDTAELVEVHAFRCRANQQICPRSGKVRALMRESTQLKNSLPIHPNASILVRQDENRMDFVRALITGTVDTPYSRGCFVFDIYFPSSYPVDPPMVKIITTGNGTVRFNPNLYADGKVCLSLLGTWHGGDASEKWDPKKSSLYQVLVSIQGMMFTPDPCFNEPGYEGMRGTDEGNALCKEYNAEIKLYTIRHAIVGQLREPTPGFEDVIRAHFRLQKEALLKQCSEWIAQCAHEEEETRMRKAVDMLKAELEKL